MSKILIIYAHPSRKEGNHAYFLEKVIEGLKTRHEDYELIDLYALNYDPVLKNEELYSSGRKVISPENLAFQEKIKNSRCLIFIYPTWWSNLPAILKGWLDRVFTGGFGFTYKFGAPIGLLKGRKAAIFSASGAPRWYSRWINFDRSLRILSHDVLRFCGIKTKNFSLGSSRRINERVKDKIDKISEQALKYLLG